MSIFISSKAKYTDYCLLRDFYGRDLGGESYFTWKHNGEELVSGQKSVFYFKDNEETLGIIISTQYSFVYNHISISTNMIGDLGVANTAGSHSIVKKLLLSAHCLDVDASICFSDDRKIASYNSIFSRYLNTSNQIIPYDEITLETFHATEEFTIRPLDSLNLKAFSNNLGRVKDQDYITYLLKHPLYQNIFYIQHNDFIAIFGLTADYVEILDISGTSSEQLCWAMRASNQFHHKCKVLLPRSRSILLYQATGTPTEIKPINMMISWYAPPKYIFDPDNTWICRLDRR